MSPDATVAKVAEFATERLRGLIASRTSNAVADAVMGGVTHFDGQDIDVVELPAVAAFKARHLQSVVAETWIDTARAVGKRLRGISKDSRPTFHPAAEFGLAPGKNELIVNLVHDLQQRTNDWRAANDALRGFSLMSTELAKIFDEMLVNDPNDPLTQKRLELLSYGASCMLRIADFSRLS